jgi:16S rRNA A1518/A1519 N6-dimethyltransferase RsmA/KsgA/DIM1 with predicted DNA glycosylase/AP lyase activity
VGEAFDALGLDETIRAERVTLEQFAELTQRLSCAEIDG